MERINERMYQANIELVDRNKLLEEDKKLLQKKINKAIELIELNICGGSISNAREVLEILKGSDFSESIDN